MKRAILLLCFAFSAGADDVETAKGLENLRNIYALAQIVDVRLALGTKPEIKETMVDPWGTEYHVDVDGYRIVGAGSDRKFDEATWQASEQFAGNDGDAVFEKGQWIRTNHNWLCKRATPDGPLAVDLKALRNAEVMFILFRTDLMRVIVGPRLTAMAIEEAAKTVESYRSEKGSLAGLTLDARDAWRTPLRLVIDGETWRIVSAGADRTFDPESWSRPPALDPAEDMVFEGGAFTRRFDENAYFKSKGTPTGEPVKHPPDPRLTAGARVGEVLEGAKVTAPVALTRVEPEYPEGYRRLRISGIVILEVAISETGAVGDIAVIKSIGPAIDMAAVDAVRQWTFKPGLAGDKPIPVLFNLTINFKLN